jgi:hypothetical protein
LLHKGIEHFSDRLKKLDVHTECIRPTAAIANFTLQINGDRTDTLGVAETSGE